MKERDLITGFMGDMKQYCEDNSIAFWYEKFPDIPVSFMSNKRYAGKKRFVDVFGSIETKPFAFEWKMHKSLGGFPFNKVTDEQMDVLEKVDITGWLPYVAIGQIFPIKDMSEKQYRDADIKLEHVTRGWLKRIYFIHHLDWHKTEEYNSTKSIRLNHLGIEPVNTIRVKGKSVWDIKSLLDKIYKIKE